ncbi:hypothetical protein GcC1_014001 [Golovinomyces cichoracearum]|uniref:Uncharacterized protein n=1 Tax=Golovinomyces cichoracearum TaxID=62708 RepID=A0A420J6N6_9PEZI|nr:hypothetical protein GcC1_014001 [Golovinomyces cichoracearum]
MIHTRSNVPLIITPTLQQWSIEEIQNSHKTFCSNKVESMLRSAANLQARNVDPIKKTSLESTESKHIIPRLATSSNNNFPSKQNQKSSSTSKDSKENIVQYQQKFTPEENQSPQVLTGYGRELTNLAKNL